MEQRPKTIEDLRINLDGLNNEIVEAANIDNVFWQVQAIIKANKNINVSDVFQDWIADTYVDSITVRIRRLSDNSQNRVSLWRLLDQMKSFSGQLTRTWFLSMHDEPQKNFAKQWFDYIAGEGSKYVSQETITKKQKELRDATAVVVQYTNEHVAHRTSQPTKSEITFGDVRKSLAHVFIVYNWCSLLLKSAMGVSPVPYYQSNWTSIFRERWLTKSEKLPDYVHLDDYIKTMVGYRVGSSFLTDFIGE